MSKHETSKHETSKYETSKDETSKHETSKDETSKHETSKHETSKLCQYYESILFNRINELEEYLKNPKNDEDIWKTVNKQTLNKHYLLSPILKCSDSNYYKYYKKKCELEEKVKKMEKDRIEKKDEKEGRVMEYQYLDDNYYEEEYSQPWGRGQNGERWGSDI